MINNLASIDGGGSSTKSVLADRSGSVQELVAAPGCNPQDNSTWRQSLDAVFDQIPDHTAVVLGMPGFGEIDENDAELLRFTARRLNIAPRVLNDVELAYASAFPDCDGVLLLAGTGSMAMAHDGSGIVRCGGWGHLFSDEGSAYWIGQQALAHATAELDAKILKNGFAGRLAETLKVGTLPSDLLEWVYRKDVPRARVAQIARHVDKLAGDNEPMAQNILDAAVDELALLAKTVGERSRFSDKFPWCHAGSVFHSTYVLIGLEEKLGPPSEPFFTPLGGGLRMAADLAGWNVDEAWIKAISSRTMSAQSHSPAKIAE